MKSRHFLLSILLMFSLSGCSNDSEFDQTLEKAQQGSAEAQFNLGVMYDYGQGVPKDDTEALKWFRLAAEQGVARAQFRLGRMYANGKGVPENDTEAVKWYRLAADQGGAGAQFRLGYMYAAGEGVPKNDIKAYVWYSLAKAQSYRGAVELIEMLKEDMSREQIAEGQALAARCSESNYKDCD